MVFGRRSAPIAPTPNDDGGEDFGHWHSEKSVDTPATSNFLWNRGRRTKKFSNDSRDDRPRRTTVVISFDERVTPEYTLPRAPRVDTENDDRYLNHTVRRTWFCCSRIVHQSHEAAKTSETDGELERSFARSKYRHFKSAFAQVSLGMFAGVLGLAISALVNDEVMRVFILSFVVAPFYLVYGIFACRRPTGLKEMHGTNREKFFIAILCVHSLCVVLAEWARPKLDYGLLVMHFGFVHNFTPLSEVVIHVIATGFSLAPYLVLKLILHFQPSASLVSVENSTVQDDGGDGALCIDTTGDAKLLLEMLVPSVILLYQCVVTMRRDSSMRLDLLCGEQLQKQKSLLARETLKAEGLLTSMLPRQIISCLMAEEPIEPQLFNDVTVIFAEICDFTAICGKLEPEVVVQVLNVVYLELDRLSDLLRVYKVETVGQVYMAVVGCPEHVVNHADVAAHFAIAATRSSEHLHKHTNGVPIQIRVGLNSGRVRAGVVGLESPRYKLFGDTVNTASRMESTCLPGRVQVSPTALERLTPGIFITEDRGEIPVKGKGTIRTAFVNGYQDGASDSREVSILHGCPEPHENSREVGAHGEEEDTGDSEPERQKTPLAGTPADMGPSTPTMRTTVPASPAACIGTVSIGTAADMGSSTPTLRMTVPASPAAGIGSVSIGNSFARSLTVGTAAERGTQHRTLLDIVNHGIRIPSLNAAIHGDKVPGNSTHGSIPRAAVGVVRYFSFRNFERLFLLVSPEEKTPEWIETLRQDNAEFLKDTLQARIARARHLTVVWLMIISAVSMLDYSMEVLKEDLERYRNALAFRALGNFMVGLIYLLLLGLQDLFMRFAQRLTFAMLLCQGIALMGKGLLIHNSEPAIVALFGAFVLFYKVCAIWQRLVICGLAVIGYVLLELFRCKSSGIVEAGNNIVFLCIFFIFMACGVRLEEHLSHVSHLEMRRVTQKLQDCSAAKAASSQLLNSLLPPHVVQLVNAGVSPIAEHHDSVTIIFTDIKGYTAYSSKLNPMELVDFLNSMYSAFDEIILNWELHKVEIIGDAYFIAAGCPEAIRVDQKVDPHEYAMRAVEVALALQRTMAVVVDDPSVQMRVGLHTGSVVAGVVGKKGPRYHLFGATVSYAEKMESHGIPGRVQLSDATHSLLVQHGYPYEFEERNIKVEGEDELQRTWMVIKGAGKAALAVQKKLLSVRHRNYAELTAMQDAQATAEVIRVGQRPSVRPGDVTSPAARHSENWGN